ncbi:unnamed protein product [Protopolystoma xenopodis]|uniref:Cyclic nucleotide-binding domain-containing protein n=1 Tax=Protopolystoma xenopodis TaxID=117903 RepID=A0A3S5BUB0_9PLAT|nr:unnamed protein product [Protopolystoma xenopodis]
MESGMKESLSKLEPANNQLTETKYTETRQLEQQSMIKKQIVGESDDGKLMTGLMDNKPKEAQPADNQVIEYFVKNSSRENISESSESLLTSLEIKPSGAFRRGGVAAESWNPEAEQVYDRVVFPKSDLQRSCLLNCIKPILIFRALEPEDLDEVVDAMFERLVVPNEEIISIGDVGDNFYVVDAGTYDIFISSPEGLKKVHQYVDQGSFGELALMYDTPRAATIRAVTEGRLWAMSRTVFRSIVLTKAFKKRQMYESLLQSVDILSHLSSFEINSIADALYPQNVEPGEIIFKEGDEEANAMYFIEQGEVEVTFQGFMLSHLKRGQYFGEVALIRHQARSATVKALTKARLAVLDVDSFNRLLGPCTDIITKKVDVYERTRASLWRTEPTDEPNHSENLSSSNCYMVKSHFEAEISVGHFIRLKKEKLMGQNKPNEQFSNSASHRRSNMPHAAD